MAGAHRAVRVYLSLVLFVVLQLPALCFSYRAPERETSKMGKIAGKKAFF